MSGTITPDRVLVNPRTRAEERLHVLETLRGHETTPVRDAVAGDFLAVPRLNGTKTGDTLAPKGSPVVVSLPAPEAPAPAGEPAAAEPTAV